MKKIFNVLGKRRILFLLFFMFIAQVTLNAQEKKLTFSLQKASLKEIIDEIKKTAHYDFVYRDANLEAFQRRDVTWKDAPVENILTECLQGTGLTFAIAGNTIVIRRQNSQPEAKKTRTLTGQVTDEKGEALPGVTVMIKGTMWGTTTNTEGVYKIEIPEGSVLLFTFVGMEDQEVIVEKQAKIDVKMVPDTEALDEVVVTGIFNKSKESYTGSVTTVTPKELKMFRGQNLLATLKNIDPAFNIMANNELGSNPNVLPEINIRGNSSLPVSIEKLNEGASKQLNAPLVIMDGFEISMQKLMDFNDEEIANINILKDAAASAIYGSRGANGVIVVTTKAPVLGKLKIFVQGGINLEMPDLSSYDLLNARDKLELEQAVGLYENKKNAVLDRRLKETYNKILAEVLKGVNTDWLSQPLRTGVGQRYNLRLEGGNEAFRWGASLGYNTVKGVMKGSERNAFSGNVTLSYYYKNLIFRNQTTIDLTKANESKYGKFSDYAAMNPYYNPKDEKGKYVKFFTLKDSDISNPLYDAQLNIIDQDKSTAIINNFSIEWNVWEALKLRGQVGVQKQMTTSDKYFPAKHTKFDKSEIFQKGSYDYGTGEDVDLDANFTLSYFKVFREKHQLYAGFDYSVSESKGHSYVFSVEGFPDEEMSFLSNALQFTQGIKPSGSESHSRRIGYTGNINYSYDNRYFADGSFRMDGSSMFGASNRFAPFWSVGIGWNIHKEKFLSKQKVINKLKLKGSYGQLGSQQFEPYQALATYNYLVGTRYMIWNGQELMGLGNKNLKWQKTDEWNGGIEVGLFQDRIMASFDIYAKKTSNLLSQMDVTLAHGFPSYMENVGEVKNNGFEAMLSGYLIRDAERDITWSVTTKLSYTKNKVTKLSEAIKRQNEIRKQENINVNKLLYEGYAQNSIWAVPSLGIDPSTGKEIFLDKNGEITSKWNPSAKQYYGISDPKYRGNLSTFFAYKNLSVNLSFAFHWGGQQYNQTLLSKVEVTKSYINQYNVDSRVYKSRWQKPGDISIFKGYDEVSTRATSRFVMDDNVFEFQSANVQYRLRLDYLRKNCGIETINIGANMSDIFYVSSIKRERGTSYPFARRLSLSLSFMF